MIHGLDFDDTTRGPLARLASSGIPIDVGQVHKVWRGMVQVDGCMEAAVPVALKWMPGQHKLPIELACSLAANELGVAVPRGVAVLAKRDQLPGLPASAKTLPGEDDFLCYGSVLQFPDDSQARLLDDAAAEEYAWRQLCSTSVAPPAAAWDELSANADRHTDNLIFDGTRYWFIDHELALEPISKMMRTFAVSATRQRFIEHRARSNAIAEQLLHRRPNDHEIQAQPVRFSRAENRLRLLCDRLRNWSEGSERIRPTWTMTEVVLRGIVLRLAPLGLMLDQRLSIPATSSLWNSSSPSSPPPS